MELDRHIAFFMIVSREVGLLKFAHDAARALTSWALADPQIDQNARGKPL